MIDTKRNICEECEHVSELPECMPWEDDEIIWGNGVGNDNIVQCKNYKGELTDGDLQEKGE